MRFPPTVLSDGERQLRAEVREFLGGETAVLGRTDMASGVDREFSRRLAARGWVAMSIPAEYGGSGRTAVDRFIVAAELLAAGAPVGGHWVSDRQTAPAILKFGSEEQRRHFLPAIAAAQVEFSIGMSEPDSGSDLASIRTAATAAAGGWRVRGTKLWTSGAHRNDFLLTLVRTSREERKHQGLSQLIVDLSADGVTIRPVIGLDGRHEFNEVILDDVFVPDAMVLGEIGSGWSQVTSELAYERSGPDRWLSTFGLFQRFLAGGSASRSTRELDAIGRIAAQYRVLYNLSLSIARVIDRGGAPAAEAALVKDIGTVFEKQVAETIRDLSRLPSDVDQSDPLASELAASILTIPSLTLRGGTTEILRSVAAKELLR
ncbi:acyl-CoA dehydrogenase family protein [Paenarthrobacter sp. NEAU-H11]|uniref:acyl-CoA dehydrogenase family protein n=1 Tax=Paenarthrobacter sp. NEAU-H11 TaxID=3423924 RepID=UPI003D3432C8